MNSQYPIFLGDLVRALADAGKDAPETWPDIAKLLGFGPAQPEQPPVIEPASLPGNLQSRRAESKGAQAGGTDGTGLQTDRGDLVEFEFEHSQSPPQTIPPVAEPGSKPRQQAPLRLASLLDPAWERGVLIEAAGREVSEGEIDIPETVDRIARGWPLADLPREMTSSVRKGCQVLIDMGAGLLPFAQDARALAEAVRHAIGAEHTQLLSFVDCPTLGAMTEDYRDIAYRPPENGAMVLALTDLCRGGPRGAVREAAPEDWLKVAKAIADAGSQLVVLNPYPPPRWPEAVADSIAVVHWDRTTRAADVRRIRRRTRR